VIAPHVNVHKGASMPKLVFIHTLYMSWVAPTNVCGHVRDHVRDAQTLRGHESNHDHIHYVHASCTHERMHPAHMSASVPAHICKISAIAPAHMRVLQRALCNYQFTYHVVCVMQILSFNRKFFPNWTNLKEIKSKFKGIKRT
jgi:hypothetical protein